MQRMKPLDHPTVPIDGRREEGGDISRRGAERLDSDYLHRPVLPLHASIAPIKRLALPSARERKKAFLSARYYSECAFRGINAVDADKAATKVRDQYGKWWPSKRKKGTNPSGDEEKQETAPKRLKVSPSTRSTLDSSNELSFLSAATRPLAVPAAESDGESVTPVSTSPTFHTKQIHAAKLSLLQELKENGGDTTSPKFLRDLDMLHSYYKAQGFDARWTQTDPSCSMDGVWLTLSKPTYSECLGQNEEGSFLYSLGRLSFDFFKPTGLRSSIDGIFQQVGLDTNSDEILVGEVGRPRTFPSSLLRTTKGPAIRMNDIVVSFTIEPNQTKSGVQHQTRDGSSPRGADSGMNEEYRVRRPIQALLTNTGYCLPDPNVSNRLSVWFSGGKLEPAIHEDDDEYVNECKLNEWKQLFDEANAPNRSFMETARILAAKCFLGANLPEGMSEDGSMRYSLQRPIGGHGQVYVDVLYCDETMRIIQGHRGSIFVSIRPLALDGLDDELE